MKSKISVLSIAFILSFPISSFGASTTGINSHTNGAVDYYVATTESVFLLLGRSGANNKIVGIEYKPSASHNICSITIALSSGTYTATGTTSDSVLLNIHHEGIRGSTSYSASSDINEQGDISRNADSSIQVDVNYPSFELETFTFSPCYVAVGGHSYLISLERTGTAGDPAYTVWSHDTSGGLPTASSGGTMSTSTPFGIRQLNDLSVISNTWDQAGVNMEFVINGTENFSAITASSTLDYSITNCTPANNILDVGGGISYALCYLFVPNPEIIDQFSDIPDLVQTKFPFSYISSLQDVFDNIASQSGTSTPNVTYDLPLGAIYTNPANGVTSNSITMFSPASTTSSVPILSTMKTYMGYIIYFMFGIFAFRQVMTIL